MVARPLPTVQVDDGSGGYMVINSSDFDPEVHSIYDPGDDGGEGDRPPAPTSTEATTGASEEDGGPADPPLPPERSETIALRADELFRTMTLTGLRQIAKTYAIEGRSNMDQRELAEAIAAAEADSFDGADE